MSIPNPYPSDQSRSAELFRRAQQVLPGGSTRTTVALPPYPIYAQAGSGYLLTDADGTARIDFTNNATALVHGHAHPAIVDAVTEQVRRGSSFANPTEAEVALAELLCERLPSAERVRFCNSGTEAVMLGIKVARAYTGRSRIAKCEGVYHGSYETAEVSLDPSPETWGEPLPVPVGLTPGTPPGVVDAVAVLPFNDAEGAAAVLAREDELACILVDPMPSRAGLVPASPAFLEVLRSHCRRTGALLMFDEVITYRVGPGGMQQELGVTPDLTALGKIIGGGFPVGALAGREDVMAVFDGSHGPARLPHAGSFNGNPVSMVAGRTALELLTPDAYARLNALSDEARALLNEVFRQAGSSGSVVGMGSLLQVRLSDAPPGYRNQREPPHLQERRLALTHHLLNSGILFNLTGLGLGTISTPMERPQIVQLADALAQGLRAAPALAAPRS